MAWGETSTPTRSAITQRVPGELLDGRGRVGKPTVDERLDERTGRKLRAIRAFDIGQCRRDGLGGGGQQGLHGLAQVGYDRHRELLGRWV